MTTPPLRRLRLQLNTFLSGPQAWIFLAQQRGYLAQEGIALDFVPGDTAANTVPKMVQDSSLDVGYGDLNALIEHMAAGKPGAPLAVFASHNASPYTLATAANGPLRQPQDLHGKHLVAHPADAALHMFPEFCACTGLDPASVRITLDAAPHSTLVPQLLAGRFDALFGFVNTLVAAALDAGLAAPREQLHFMQYHDHLPELYGMALFVARPLAAQEPALVRGLLGALNRALVDTVADPEAAIGALAEHAGEGFAWASNLQRLKGTLALEMGRAEGARLGIGDLDDERLARSVALITQTKRLPYAPKAAALFSREFLPPLTERVRNLAQADAH